MMQKRLIPFYMLFQFCCQWFSLAYGFGSQGWKRQNMQSSVLLISCLFMNSPFSSSFYFLFLSVFFFSSHFFSCSSQVKVSKTCHCCLMWSSTWSTNVLIDGKKLPGCSSVGSVLSLHHINPLGKRCYLEHIISGDAYQKDKIQHQDAKGENELLDITEIKGKE